MNHPVAASGPQEDLSDGMEDVRSDFSRSADPQLAQSGTILNNDDNDNIFQDDDDDDDNINDSSSEGERDNDLGDPPLLDGGLGGEDERYYGEVGEMELERLEAFSSIIHGLQTC
jgi:hypothetical protein